MTARARSIASSSLRPCSTGAGTALRFPRRLSMASPGYPSTSVRSPARNAHGHSGWVRIDSGLWVYLHADGAIVGEDSPPFSGRVVLIGKLARRKFPQIPTDLEEVR